MIIQSPFILGVGNIYVETNYIGLVSGGIDEIVAGREYRANTYETRLGGSVVNFVTQAQKFGARVGLIGKIGTDETGDKLLTLLKNEHIVSNLIVRSSDVQTCVDTGIVFAHNGKNIQLVSGNSNQLLSLSDINLTDSFLDSTQAVYLGGFLKQESLYKDYPQLLSKFKEKNVRIFLDHGRIPVDVSDDKRRALFSSLPFVEGYLPNEEEILGITGKAILDDALESIFKLGMSFIAVKRGSKGCLVRTKNEKVIVKGHTIPVISTVGAGDVFNAAFVTQYLVGKSIKECAQFANAAAALRISTNKQPIESDVQNFLANSPISS